MNYNLLEKKWIPVLKTDGTFCCIGIKEAFTQATSIRQIAANNPMDRAAILRFLLALLYWCKGNPPEDKTNSAFFTSDCFTKLDNNKEYFNLLGDGKRFYQYKKTSNGKTANYLIQEIPTGNNFWHFRHSIDKKDGLCLACCAMGLLRLPMFATSGGQGTSPEQSKSPGINGKPPVYVISIGATLAETLKLLWNKEYVLGTPSWEKPDLQLPQNSGIVGLLTGLTWLPRRVWLIEPDRCRKASCIACGRSAHLIRHCEFEGLGSIKDNKKDNNWQWKDPHVICNRKERVKVITKGDFDTHIIAKQWRDITDGILYKKKTRSFIGSKLCYKTR